MDVAFLLQVRHPPHADGHGAPDLGDQCLVGDLLPLLIGDEQVEQHVPGIFVEQVAVEIMLTAMAVDDPAAAMGDQLSLGRVDVCVHDLSPSVRIHP